ncbi:MAG TPA: nuclear transport factor 2 family protein [Thermoleophilaceae bacterium]|nr:nuclear transport factor 2 family protein [Thermoleophilaceae bacterium]
MASENADAARRGFEAAMRGDLDPIENLLDPNVKWHGGDPASGCQNKEEALNFMRQALENGFAAELVDVIDAGNQVIVVLKPANAPEPRANLTTFRDGKVVEMVAFESPEDAQLAASS